MKNLIDRHKRFEALHQNGCFIIVNPWDIGSARVMAAQGAQALATTSSGFAFTQGKPDMGNITRDQALAHAQEIISATNLPVSGDLENGFGDTPDDVARTVKMAAEVGLSGCSIEDTVMPSGKAYDFDLAVERIKAGSDAVRSLGRPFVFCARADGIMNGTYDKNEAIRRLQAFEEAGADLLYAPLPNDMNDLKEITHSVSKPVNALAAGLFRTYTKLQFEKIGIRRISIGSALARVTHHHIAHATSLMCEKGDFSGLKDAASGDMIDAMLKKGGA